MTDSSSALRGLIERLEAAQEGSRELDGRIQAAISWGSRPEAVIEFSSWGGFVVRIGDSRCLDEARGTYTTSLDAALTLVPEGAWWHVQCLPNPHIADRRVSASVTTYRLHEWHHGATPALALCIAALKARAQ
jgi:hypothetical protein